MFLLFPPNVFIYSGERRERIKVENKINFFLFKEFSSYFTDNLVLKIFQIVVHIYCSTIQDSSVIPHISKCCKVLCAFHSVDMEIVEIIS